MNFERNGVYMQFCRKTTKRRPRPASLRLCVPFRQTDVWDKRVADRDSQSVRREATTMRAAAPGPESATFQRVACWCCVDAVWRVIVLTRKTCRSPDLGIAMQLTNILRDIKEDKEMGRIYLPLSELKQYGVSEADIISENMTAGMYQLMRFQI